MTGRAAQAVRPRPMEAVAPQVQVKALTTLQVTQLPQQVTQIQLLFVSEAS